MAGKSHQGRTGGHASSPRLPTQCWRPRSWTPHASTILVLLAASLLRGHASEDGQQTFGMVARMEKELQEAASEEPHEKRHTAGRSNSCPRDELFGHLTLATLLRESPFFDHLLVWDPPGDKFLVMECNFGRVTNRLICIQNHILFAGLLNRTLVFDTLQLEFTVHHYNWSILVDIPHIRECFGERAAITTEEYMAAHGGKKLRVDAVLCWNARCDVHWDVWSRTVEEAAVHKVLNLHTYDQFVERLMGQYADVPAFMVGDIFGSRASFFRNTSQFADVPFRRTAQCRCPATLLPNALIMRAAQDFVARELGGEPFLALHFRGGDFYARCKTEPEACPNMDETVEQLAAEAEATGVYNIVFCSDMTWQSTSKLIKKLKNRDQRFRVILDPELPEELNSLVGRANEGQGAYQKAIMARAHVFVGTQTSTFTLDVERMRINMRTSNCRDSYLHH